MRWEDTGLLIEIKDHGERDLVIRVFTESHGLCAGLVKGGQNKKQKSILNPGPSSGRCSNVQKIAPRVVSVFLSFLSSFFLIIEVLPTPQEPTIQHLMLLILLFTPVI